MNICPITYQPCGDKKYSDKGLKLLSRNLTQLKEFPLTQEEQLREAAIRADKMSIQGVQPKLSAKLNVKDEVFDIVNDRNKAIRIIATAKSALRHNLADTLHRIKAPTLLVWGKDDTVTPAFVGEKFHELIPNSRLYILDRCGHAPMMEHPLQFNEYLEEFLQDVVAANPIS